MPQKLTGRVMKLVEVTKQTVYARLDLELGNLSTAELESIAAGTITSECLERHPGLARAIEDLRRLNAPDGCADDDRVLAFMARVDFSLCSDWELEQLCRDDPSEELLSRIERRIAKDAPQREVTDGDGKRWIEARGPTGAVIILPHNGREPSPDSGVSAGVNP